MCPGKVEWGIGVLPMGMLGRNVCGGGASESVGLGLKENLTVGLEGADSGGGGGFSLGAG